MAWGQCSWPCHQENYDNEAVVRQMMNEQRDMRVPPELIPHCLKCGRPMTMNPRADDTFVENVGWHAAARQYSDLLRRHENAAVLFLELDVGGNMPGIIKYPFWQTTNQTPKATYVCINYDEAVCPTGIEAQAIFMGHDAGSVIAA